LTRISAGVKNHGEAGTYVMSADATSQHAPASADRPRKIVGKVSPADRVFRGVTRGAGLTVFVLTGLILTFLLARAIHAFGQMGFSFFTTQTWDIDENKYGIGSLIPNGMIIAVIALVIAIPVAVATALYISEYAPGFLRRPLTTMMDLMAAIPSIVYALWGFAFLEVRMTGFDSWLARHLSFLPFFKVPGPLDLAATFTDAPFVVGVVVSLMVIPIVSSLTREIFSQAPQAEREGAYALGATRWGMVRMVVLPFGRAGIIGSSMLGMGRALGDAIVISFLITPIYTIGGHILASGGNSIPYMIVLGFTNGPKWLAALMAAGVVLFALTLIVNILGSLVSGRSRAGLVTVD
jgi:phosphate transport system permease protein